MGSQWHDPPSVAGDGGCLIDDLKVTIEDTSLVLPSRTTERRSMFLSNIDKVLNFTVETLHFFPAHPDFPAVEASQRLKESLAELLVSYDFFAGRLKNAGVSGRLEVDCNAAGAAFVAASSQLGLDDIGDLAFPNPAFSQLVVKTIDALPPEDHPLFIMQVTKFKCGGFAMAISNSHTLSDGVSFKLFLQNLAAVAAGIAHMPFPPCNDRYLLAARSPPRVAFPHLELTKLQDSTPQVFESTKEALCFKIFRFTAADVEALKERGRTSSTRPDTRISGFNVISAFVWRCKALSSSITNDPDRESTLLFAVDIRQRLVPPLPETFCGNAVLTSYARATCRELEQWPLGKVAELVAEGANRMTDEYARSAIDWGEINQGFPRGEVLISSWWKLGFEEVRYPWGRPRYSCPVVYLQKDIILLFCDHNKNKGGVNVFVALPADEMSKFQSILFDFFLSCIQDI